MTDQLSREEIRRRVRARRGKTDPEGEVPGPSENPATNLLLADITMRFGTYLLRGGVEKAFLRKRYGSDTANDIVEGRSIARTLSAIAVAKFASKSKVGAALVGTGLMSKVLYDRSRSRRKNRLEGDSVLLEQAENEG